MPDPSVPLSEPVVSADPAETVAWVDGVRYSVEVTDSMGGDPPAMIAATLTRAAGPSGSLGGPGLSEDELAEGRRLLLSLRDSIDASTGPEDDLRIDTDSWGQWCWDHADAIVAAAPPVSREEGGEGLAEALVHASHDACTNVPYDQKGDCLTWWSEDPRSWCASCTIVAYLAAPPSASPPDQEA